MEISERTLVDYLVKQLSQITDYYKDTSIEVGAGDSITLISSVHFDKAYITVDKGVGIAGWTKKHEYKNDYAVSFQITPISDEQINIEVFSRGIIANAMLRSKYVDGEKSWVFDNFNRTLDSWYASEYPYIQFTNSFNKSNTFTGFIAYYIGLIKKCLNDEFHDYEDDSSYDSEPEYKDTAPEGDLILTINDKTYNTLKRLGKAIKLSDGTLLPVTKDMFGKKVVRKDSKPEVLFPLNESDFVG